jgi:hypothetical protein
MTIHSLEDAQEEIVFIKDLAKGRFTTMETKTWEAWNYSDFSPLSLGSLASSCC